MGKNISVYCNDSTLANMDLLKQVFEDQDKEDGWEFGHKYSRSDIIAIGISLAFDLYVSKTVKLENR